MVRFVSDDERRARLGRRHALAVRTGTVEDGVNSVVALHSSDPATVYLSLLARVGDFSHSDLERALYESRSLVRVLGMRRTMFVLDRAGASIIDAACTQALYPAQHRRVVGLIETQGFAEDPAHWLEQLMADTLEALRRHGPATAAELKSHVPLLATRLQASGSYGSGTLGVSTRVLFLLATDGTIVRGKPRGSWLSSLYEWAETEQWLGHSLSDCDREAASRLLIERYLARFGPATLTDIKWWTGWTVRDTKAALAAVDAVEVEVNVGTGFVLPGDDEPVAAPDGWVAFLPALDPTPMGWKERNWYLGDHREQLFDRNGNIGPTVWVDGRIVGGWGQDSEGGVRYELFEDVDEVAAIEAERDRVAAWLGDTTVTPRFRTPFEKRLRQP